jgi:hypothetical protein
MDSGRIAPDMAKRRRNLTVRIFEHGESPSAEIARRMARQQQYTERQAERASRRKPKPVIVVKAPRQQRDSSQPSGYKLRAQSLSILGFSSYREYLASPLWARIRSRVLHTCRYQCKSCLKRATQVHHRHYALEVMSGQNIGSLIALCGDCHKDIEFAEGQKTKLGTANKRLADNLQTTRTAIRISVAKGSIQRG